MFGNMVTPTPEDLNPHVLAWHRHALQLASPPGPKTTPHWPTSHFVQLKIGRRQDATVVTYEVQEPPKALAVLLRSSTMPLMQSKHSDTIASPCCSASKTAPKWMCTKNAVLGTFLIAMVTTGYLTAPEGSGTVQYRSGVHVQGWKRQAMWQGLYARWALACTCTERCHASLGMHVSL